MAQDDASRLLDTQAAQNAARVAILVRESSVVISRHQSSSVIISGHQWSSVVISGPRVIEGTHIWGNCEGNHIWGDWGNLCGELGGNSSQSHQLSDTPRPFIAISSQSHLLRRVIHRPVGALAEHSLLGSLGQRTCGERNRASW